MQKAEKVFLTRILPVVAIIAQAILAGCSPLVNQNIYKTGDLVTATQGFTLYSPDIDPLAGMPGHEFNQKCSVSKGDELVVNSVDGSRISLTDKKQPIPDQMPCSGVTWLNKALQQSIEPAGSN